jgi:hypothetical protein
MLTSQELWFTLATLLNAEEAQAALEESDEMTVGYDEAVMLKDWTERQLELLSEYTYTLTESELMSIRKRKSSALETSPTFSSNTENATPSVVSDMRRQVCKWYRSGQIDILKELMIDIQNLLTVLDKYEDTTSENEGEEDNCGSEKEDDDDSSDGHKDAN